MLLQQGKAICEYDELSANTLHNQILKSTLRRLSRLWGVDAELRRECGSLLVRFNAVSEIQLSPKIFHRVIVHSNNRYYRFLNHLCQLIYYETLMEEKAGRYRFEDFFREDGRMAKLYEKFIFNFYKKRQSEYEVKSERIRWNASSQDDPNLKLLPTMLTDISLRNRERTLIIDAKYYADLFQRHQDQKRFHSGNLYQIYAYLKNIENRNEIDRRASGMLLYPVVNEEVSSTYMIDGHEVRIETIDLARRWEDVEKKLLSLIQ